MWFGDPHICVKTAMKIKRTINRIRCVYPSGKERKDSWAAGKDGPGESSGLGHAVALR